MGSILCEHCAAACCRYVAIPLDKPENARDYSDMRWYLMHENISVFLEDGDWYIQFQTRCKNLASDNRCKAYETRPHICREYEAGECDYSGGNHGYDEYFTHAKQVDAYYEKKTGKKLPLPDGVPKRRRSKSGKKKTA
ncbi:MAG: YkgJ family cysteine cluster protein [Phycisphaerales bacterium]|nr:MAG: YkgJ family cysteine cluster protein [Phycisphaerales bacterium]